MRSIAVTGLLASVCWSSATAQVFIVDAGGGPGAHFTDLPRAVASVPDGATLRVRPGDYTRFTLHAKGLAIVGEGTVTMRKHSSLRALRIAGTRPDQTVLLRGLNLPQWAGVEIVDARGPVVLDGCRRDGLTCWSSLCPASDIAILRSANVHLHACELTAAPAAAARSSDGAAVAATDSTLQISRCSIVGFRGPGPPIGYGRSPPGSIGVALIRSRCLLVHSRIVGGVGGPACNYQRGAPGACRYDGGHGGIGCRLENATLVSLGSTITGGPGAVPACRNGVCTCPGDGGPGLHATDSRLFVLGPEPSGGVPGGTTCGAKRGPPHVLVRGNRVHLDTAATPPSVVLVGAQERGSSIAITVRARAGAAAVLLASRDPALTALEPLVFGSVLTAPEITLPAGTVPSSGVLRVGWRVPRSFALGSLHVVQAATINRRGVFTSNTAPLLLAR